MFYRANNSRLQDSPLQGAIGLLDQDGEQIDDLQKQLEELKLSKAGDDRFSEQNENVPPNTTNYPQIMNLEGKKITVPMIIGPKDTKKNKMQIDLVLKKMTHLHLENKGIEVIENLNLCPKLLTIYLQEN